VLHCQIPTQQRVAFRWSPFKYQSPALNCFRVPVCLTTFQPAISTWNNTDGATHSETQLTGRSPILVDHEIQWLQYTAPTVFETLHDVGSRNTTTLRKTLDVDLFFQPHDVLQWQERKRSTRRHLRCIPGKLLTCISHELFLYT
jgi:hypothetical protein